MHAFLCTLEKARPRKPASKATETVTALVILMSPICPPEAKSANPELADTLHVLVMDPPHLLSNRPPPSTLVSALSWIHYSLPRTWEWSKLRNFKLKSNYACCIWKKKCLAMEKITKRFLGLAPQIRQRACQRWNQKCSEGGGNQLSRSTTPWKSVSHFLKKFEKQESRLMVDHNQLKCVEDHIVKISKMIGLSSKVETSIYRWHYPKKRRDNYLRRVSAVFICVHKSDITLHVTEGKPCVLPGEDHNNHHKKSHRKSSIFRFYFMLYLLQADAFLF